MSWLRDKAKQAKLTLTAEALSLLADYTEGDLLLAKQNVLLLELMYGQTPVTPEAIQTALQSNPRYTVFEWVDKVLACDKLMALKMLDTMKAQGEQPILMLWALAKDLRTCIELCIAIAEKYPLDTAFEKTGVWRSRQGFFKKSLNKNTMHSYEKALCLCAEMDLAIKGLRQLDPFLLLSQSVLLLTGE